ncbi:MAG: AMP-binding protein [Planctomycetota bacterium]
MNPSTDFQKKLRHIRDSWSWSRDQIRDWQLEQLNAQLAEILPANEFYRAKFGDTLQLESLDQLADLPTTTKEELVAGAEAVSDHISPHHTYPASAYSRFHRTSGTTGNPLPILDTDQDWQSFWSITWQHVLEAANIDAHDRVFLAFSFGPFIGFWSAHQACVDRGALVIPGGGLSSLARLEFMRSSKANVLCCTPSYALHLADVAAQEDFDIGSLPLEKIIVAGEAGGSVPEVRSRLERVWQAKVIDHIGATEVGPWGFGWPDKPGLHIIETSFIAELLPLGGSTSVSASSASVERGTLSELVLTSLGRYGAPVIRYRTGDAVRALRPEEGLCKFLWMPEGVVGRADSMVTIRGVNVFPSSIDAVVREFDAISEYQVLISRHEALDQMELRIESDPATRESLAKRLQTRLGLRMPVELVPSGSLPRSELKSRRWIDQR